MNPKYLTNPMQIWNLSTVLSKALKFEGQQLVFLFAFWDEIPNAQNRLLHSMIKIALLIIGGYKTTHKRNYIYFSITASNINIKNIDKLN